jgi:transposase-like protein
MCPDCDADLLETMTGAQMTSQRRRYYCVDCGAKWRAARKTRRSK